MEVRQPTRSAIREFKRGWMILPAALLGCGFGTTSLPLYTAGVFVPALQADFGWTRTELSFAITLFTFSLAASSPIVGILIDRFGVRRTASISIVLAAACYLAIGSFLGGIHSFYAAHIAIAVLGSAAAPVAYTRVIASHFHETRGLALGITLLGPSLVAAIAPTMISLVIADFGWRSGYFAIAVAMLSVLPFIPLLSEGAGAPKVQRSSAARPVHMFEAAVDRTIFMTLFAALAFFSLGVGGLIVHLVPLLVDQGLAMDQAARIAGLIGLSGLIGRIVGGALADLIFAPFILVTVAVLAAGGCLLFALDNVAAAMIASLFIGFSLGAEADLMSYLVSRYFHPEVYGRVFGWQYAMFISGIGIGPLILATVRDAYGTYTPALFGCAALLVVAAILFSLLPRYSAINTE